MPVGFFGIASSVGAAAVLVLLEWWGYRQKRRFLFWALFILCQVSILMAVLSGEKLETAYGYVFVLSAAFNFFGSIVELIEPQEKNSKGEIPVILFCAGLSTVIAFSLLR